MKLSIFITILNLAKDSIKNDSKLSTSIFLRIDRIKKTIQKLFPRAKVLVFGSFATKLYLPDGDVDIAVLTDGHYSST